MSKELSVIPKVGQSIEAVINYNDKTREFRTKVEEVSSFGMLKVSRFLEESIHNLDHIYKDISVQAVIDKKLVSWDAEFITTCSDTVTVTLTSDAKKCNRRSTFRVPYVEKLQIVDGPKITTSDISQTGVGFVSFEKFKVGDKFKLEFGEEFCNAIREIEIVREEIRTDSYKYGAKFTDDVDFCKCIFNIQRHLIKSRSN